MKKLYIGIIVAASLIIIAIIITIVIIKKQATPPTPSGEIPTTPTTPTTPTRTWELREGRTNQGGQIFYSNTLSPLRGAYPADIEHWRIVTGMEDDDDVSSQIVESPEECAALFQQYNDTRNLSAETPRALAFSVSKKDDSEDLVCRLQDRLVVDLNDLGQIEDDENESVGRWHCQEYLDKPEEDSVLSCPTLEVEPWNGIQVPLCEWEDENNKCVEFTPLKYTLAQDEIKVAERQGVPASGSCKTSSWTDGSRRCPEGSVVWGYEGRSGAFMDQVKLKCAYLKNTGTLDREQPTFTDTLGNSLGGAPFAARSCAKGSGLVGTTNVHFGNELNTMGTGACQPLQKIARTIPNDENYETLLSLPIGGNKISDPAFCPPGYVATGIVDGAEKGGGSPKPCAFYWNCQKIESSKEGTIWDIDYPYFEDG